MQVQMVCSPDAALFTILPLMETFWFLPLHVRKRREGLAQCVSQSLLLDRSISEYSAINFLYRTHNYLLFIQAYEDTC